MPRDVEVGKSQCLTPSEHADPSPDVPALTEPSNPALTEPSDPALTEPSDPALTETSEPTGYKKLIAVTNGNRNDHRPNLRRQL